MQAINRNLLAAAARRHQSRTEFANPKTKHRREGAEVLGHIFYKGPEKSRAGRLPLVFPFGIEPRFSGLRSLRRAFGPSHGPHSNSSRVTKITVLPGQRAPAFPHRGLCLRFCPLGHAHGIFVIHLRDWSRKILLRVCMVISLT